MNEFDTGCFEQLKNILKNVRSPESLDDHPWTQSLIVQEALDSTPQLNGAGPGQRLVSAIAGLFRQMKPPAPPRRGKRLDPRWGEFGLLAALYFVPFEKGTAFPTSLLDAWVRIDPAILHFVDGKPAEDLEEPERNLYRLVGTDVEYGAASTLSDWHKKGLQRLAEIIVNQERFLSRSSSLGSPILSANGTNGHVEPAQAHKPWRLGRRAVWVSLALLLIVLLSLAAIQSWRIYRSGMLVYQDATQLRELASGPITVGTITQALPLLQTMQNDLDDFQTEAQIVLWLCPRLGWVPVYGNDLAAAPALVEFAGHTLQAAILSSEATEPFLDELDARGSSLAATDLIELLLASQPGLEAARTELDLALAARGSIQTAGLSPRLQGLLMDELDPLLLKADEGLTLALALPGLVGAGSEGPKTYLLLVQNEDELRPTGGFITAVGNLVVHKGKIISLSFEEAGELEDWTQPYPAAPWQLREYMNSPVLVLRDSNWFPDFPTAALWAEYLYAYTHSHSVDGVIAFDQHLLVMLLTQLGPLQVEGVPYAITDQNVVQYMREAKEPPPGQPAGWYRKAFIGELADVVLDSLTSSDRHDWLGVADALARALTERHLLLQFDDPAVTALTARRSWDNSIQPGAGDFLLVTDTNIGFNKTNAVVDVSLSYDIDLTDPASPEGTLVVTHTNNATQDVPCIHWNTGEITGEESYPINRCYWSYVRVYKQAGAQLLDATPHLIPAEWMILGESVPARVDVLEEEEMAGVQAFGTLLVVPGGQTLSTSFRFALPQTVLSSQAGSNELVLHIHIRKQPGTLENPLTVRVHFPKQALLKSIPPGASVQNNDLMLQTNLLTDVELEVVFTIP